MERLSAEERATIKAEGCPECGGDTQEVDIDSMQPGGTWQLQCTDCDWKAWAPER